MQAPAWPSNNWKTWFYKKLATGSFKVFGVVAWLFNKTFGPREIGFRGVESRVPVVLKFGCISAIPVVAMRLFEIFDARRALPKLSIVICLTICRARGRTKMANGYFFYFVAARRAYKNCKQLFFWFFAARRALQKQQTVIFQHVLFYYHPAPWPRLFILFVSPGRIHS